MKPPSKKTSPASKLKAKLAGGFMNPVSPYNVSVTQGQVGPWKSPRVGLLHERTGVPVFLLYLRGLDTIQHWELHSSESLEAEFLQAAPADRAAWESLVPFFLADGSNAHVVAVPISDEPTLAELLGHNHGLVDRTGIHVLRSFRDHADLVVVPQASMLLSAEEHRVFYEGLFQLVMELRHFFCIVDFPNHFSIEDVREWTRGTICGESAAYFPWAIHDGKATPPGPVAAAAYQVNDRAYGINDLPANRDIAGHFRPEYRLTPVQVRALSDSRVNSLVQWTSSPMRLWGGTTLAEKLDVNGRFASTQRTLLALSEAIHAICEPFVLEPATDELAQFMNATLQSFFQNCRKLFHPDAAEPFTSAVSLERRARQDFMEVNVKFSIPYVMDQLALSLAMTG